MAKKTVKKRAGTTRKVAKKKVVKKVVKKGVAVSSPAPASQTAPPHPPHPYLEEVLVALQKSFSRVNNQSAGVPENQARALMVGDVSFQLSLQVEPAPGKTEAMDRLLVKPDGGISLNLSGRIDTDIHITSNEETDSGEER